MSYQEDLYQQNNSQIRRAGLLYHDHRPSKNTSLKVNNRQYFHRQYWTVELAYWIYRVSNVKPECLYTSLDQSSIGNKSFGWKIVCKLNSSLLVF